MTEFKFNFDIEDEVTGNTLPVKDTHERNENSKAFDRTATYFTVADIVLQWDERYPSDAFSVDDISTSKGTISTVVLSSLSEERDATDLVSSVYEGGFKVWECTMDLIEYLSLDAVKGKTVLDLGCGVGLLGVHVLKYCEAAYVTFQDFNESVIVEATAPTALWNFHGGSAGGKDRYRNTKTEDRQQEYDIEALTILQNVLSPEFIKIASTKMDFVCGDWSVLSESSNSNIDFEQYDVIVTSETIYNEANYSALHEYLKSTVKKDGEVVMSAKSHYFGVGGSVHSWVEFVNLRGVFDVEIVKTIDASLKRHILRMVRK